MSLLDFLRGPRASLERVESVEKSLGLPVLAVAPRTAPAREGPFFRIRLPGSRAGVEELRGLLAFHHSATSPFSDAYQTLRTALPLPLRPGARPGAVVGFVSAAAEEGRTLSALNFALTTAQRGVRTLFIDADLRAPAAAAARGRPGLWNGAHALFGIAPEPGLSEAVLQGTPWRPLVRGTSDFLLSAGDTEPLLRWPGIDNFRLLPCGAMPSNPADVLEAPALRALLREARAEHDLVVLDGAPVSGAADALLAAPLADGWVLVHRPCRSGGGALKRAKDQLTGVKARLLGVFLTDT